MVNALVGEKLKFSVETTEGKVTIDGQLFDLDLKPLGKGRYHVLSKHKSYILEVMDFDAKGKTMKIEINGKPFKVAIQEPLDILIAEMGMDSRRDAKLPDLMAPMPGLITAIMIKEGDEVKTGDPLLVLQAMKMENIIKSAGNGHIKKLLASVGQSIEKNQLLVQF